MGELSYTVGGDSNLVSFKSAARVPITSLKAHFKPKQDLHGYSKPWPAGGGKNLFNWKDASMSYFMWPDNSKINSQSNTKSAIIPCKPNTTYTMSKDVESVVTVGCWIKEAPAQNVPIFGRVQVSSGPVTITTGEDAVYIVFWYYNNAQNNETMTPDEIAQKVQIEVGSSATSYEPYENICPIEGWQNTEITHCAKNILGGIELANKIKAVDSRITIDTTAKTIKFWGGHVGGKTIVEGIFKPNTPYTFVFKTAEGTTRINLGVIYTDGTQDITFNDTITTVGSTSKTIKSLYGFYRSGDTILYYDECGIFEGVITEAKYEEYKGNKIPITFPVLGKNKFNWNVEQSYSTPNSSDNSTARNFTLNTYVVGLSFNNFYRSNYTNWVINPSVSNGVISMESSSATGYGIGFPLSLVAGQTYFISGTVTGSGDISSIYYDEDGKMLSYQSYRINKTIIIPDNAVTTVIVFWPAVPNTAVSFSNIQIELGVTATEYEPYNPDNIVYGGYVDIAAGEVVQEWKMVDLGDYNWNYSYNSTLSYFSYLFSDRKIGAFNLYCSNLFVSDKTSPNNLKDCSLIGSTINGYVFIRCDSITSSPDFTTVMAGVKLVYELAAPIHYPLSPTELSTFLNQNNIWSNTNDITEVSYAIHDAAPIRAAKHRIAANEPHIETVNGSMVHFSTDMKTSLKSCKVYFNPVQEGSGDPSPNNVRTISGWTGFEVCKTGKNLFNINANWQNLLSTYKYAKMLPNELCRIRFIPKNLSVDLTGCSLGFVYFEPNSVAQANKGYNWVMESGVIKADNRLHNKVVGGDYSGLYCQYIFVYPGTDEALNAITSAYDIEIEPDNLNTNYEPYIGTTLPLNWSSTAGTIYGGYVDLVNGEVVNCWRYITLSSDYNVYVSGSSYRGTTCTDAWFDIQSIGYTTSYVQNQTSDDIQCDKFALVSKCIWGDPDTYPWKCVLNSYNQLHCVFVNDVVGITSEDSNTVAIAKIKTWIDENPVNVAYRVSGNLITHHPLSTTALKTLRGINNIWSTANDSIDISYWKH